MALVVLDSTLVLDLAIPMQAFGKAVFTELGGRANPPYDVVLCGEVPTTRGAELGPSFGELAPVEEIATADTVVIPGLQDPLTAQDPAVLQAVGDAARSGSRMISLCAGAFVLGQAGLLDGRRVTTHWLLADAFRAAFPRTELVEDAIYVDDGQFLSSGGILAAADLCLHVLRSDLGAAYSYGVARLLIRTPEDVSPARTAGPAPVLGSGDALASLLDWLAEHLHEHLDLQRIAERAHLSTRTLLRHFRAHTGSTPKEWIIRRRVEAARALLEETDLTVSQVAHNTGFGSAETMRRAFAVRVGVSPRDYRSATRARSWSIPRLHHAPSPVTTAEADADHETDTQHDQEGV
ncbi:GlxA family transcriptional regulator [Pseudonocardia sp. CA-142604]|uniref:GlxA family transcriptional regulator n=1 Tax=Pseudonocardia sp. CA-142604 TaxID=3240024 RepID=UPI003D8CA235